MPYAVHLTHEWNVLVDLYYEYIIKAMRADTYSVFLHYKDKSNIVFRRLQEIQKYLHEP